MSLKKRISLQIDIRSRWVCNTRISMVELPLRSMVSFCHTVPLGQRYQYTKDIERNLGACP